VWHLEQAGLRFPKVLKLFKMSADFGIDKGSSPDSLPKLSAVKTLETSQKL